MIQNYYVKMFILNSKILLHSLKLINRNYSSNVMHVPICCGNPPPMNVLVVGANSKVGQVVALHLKTRCLIRKLFLYDTKNTYALKDEINTISTSTKIECVTNKNKLRRAVEESRIMVICGGLQVYPNKTAHELFDKNADRVREYIMFCTEFNPDIHICISTPPVCCLVPMAVEECKKVQIHNARKVYGIITPIVMRASGLLLKETGTHYTPVPIIGGSHRSCIVPVLSTTKIQMAPTKVEMLTRSIQEGEEDVLQKRKEECQPMCLHWSIGTGIAKFVSSLVKAICGKKPVQEYTYVKQKNPLKIKARYLSCLAKINANGVYETSIPKLSEREQTKFKNILEELRDHIHRAESFITGAEKPFQRQKIIPQKESRMCYIHCEKDSYREPGLILSNKLCERKKLKLCKTKKVMKLKDWKDPCKTRKKPKKKIQKCSIYISGHKQ